MKKIIKLATTLFLLAATIHNQTAHGAFSRGQKNTQSIPATPRSIITQARKNDAQAAQLAQQMQQTKQALASAPTKKERQRLKQQLKDEFEKSVSFLDSTQNLFFGTGRIAEFKKQQAEKRKPILIEKLKAERRNYQQLVKNPISKANEALKQKSLERQAIIKRKIKIEDIALGNAWSTKQYLLAAGAAATAAALGISYAAPLLTKGYGMYIATSNPVTANMTWTGAAAATAGSLGLKLASANIQGRAMRRIMQPIMQYLYPADETPLLLILTQQFTPEEMAILGFMYNNQHNVWLTSTRKLIINPDETPYKASELPSN